MDQQDDDKQMSRRIRCPRCRKQTAVPILWGFPSPDDLDKVESGEWDVVIGGCVIPAPFVNAVCRRCGHRWPHEDGGRTAP